MIAATGQAADKFNLSCFTGKYPVNIGHHRLQIREPASRHDKPLWSTAA